MSDNKQIDFTTVPRPFGVDARTPVKPSTDTEESVIGFRVKPHEKAIIQEYCDTMYHAVVTDPTTGKPARMLEKPSVGLFVKAATLSYMIQFNYIMANFEEAKKRLAQQKGQVRNVRR